jgi:hypothetical protein
LYTVVEEDSPLGSLPERKVFFASPKALRQPETSFSGRRAEASGRSSVSRPDLFGRPPHLAQSSNAQGVMPLRQPDTGFVAD